MTWCQPLTSGTVGSKRPRFTDDGQFRYQAVASTVPCSTSYYAEHATAHLGPGPPGPSGLLPAQRTAVVEGEETFDVEVVGFAHPRDPPAPFILSGVPALADGTKGVLKIGPFKLMHIKTFYARKTIDIRKISYDYAHKAIQVAVFFFFFLSKRQIS